MKTPLLLPSSSRRTVHNPHTIPLSGAFALAHVVLSTKACVPRGDSKPEEAANARAPSPKRDGAGNVERRFGCIPGWYCLRLLKGSKSKQPGMPKLLCRIVYLILGGRPQGITGGSCGLGLRLHPRPSSIPAESWLGAPPINRRWDADASKVLWF